MLGHIFRHRQANEVIGVTLSNDRATIVEGGPDGSALYVVEDGGSRDDG